MAALTNVSGLFFILFWKLNKAFIRNLLNEFPDPKPASTTVLTLLKRMIDKGFVDYRQFGNLREYYPLIQKANYFSDHINGLIKDFFNNSTAQFASFFTNETEMSAEELKELRDIVDKKIASKKLRNDSIYFKIKHQPGFIIRAVQVLPEKREAIHIQQVFFSFYLLFSLSHCHLSQFGYILMFLLLLMLSLKGFKPYYHHTSFVPFTTELTIEL